MKKYRVNEKHGILKKDIVLESTHTGYFSREWAHEFPFDEINEWLESGCIEEIQEPEFTENQLMSFGNLCINDYIHGHHYININESFNKFKALPSL